MHQVGQATFDALKQVYAVRKEVRKITEIYDMPSPYPPCDYPIHPPIS